MFFTKTNKNKNSQKRELFDASLHARNFNHKVVSIRGTICRSALREHLCWFKKKIYFLWKDRSPCWRPQSSNSCHWMLPSNIRKCFYFPSKYISKVKFHIPKVIFYIPKVMFHIPKVIFHIPKIIFQKPVNQKISYSIFHIPHICHIPYSIFRNFLSQPINGIHISTGSARAWI